MELTANQKFMIREAVRLCAKNADCDTIARIFDAADWHWIDCVTKETFVPAERDIRRRLYRLGIDAYESLCKDCECGQWNADDPRPYTIASGRLYFTIDWQEITDTDDYDIIKDAYFVCGINTEMGEANFENVSEEEFGVYTYGGDGIEETVMTKL